jgi:DNA-binding NarL/FixJ family response regulator
MSRTPHPSESIRLTLVNDHPIVVAGLRELLAPYGERVQVVELASRFLCSAISMCSSTTPSAANG